MKSHLKSKSTPMISRDIFLIFSVSMLNSHGFTNPKLFSPNLLLVLISSKQIFIWESNDTKNVKINHLFLSRKAKKYC